MDLEKTKKFNEMSKILKQHGIAINSVDGVAKASQIIGDNIKESDSMEWDQVKETVDRKIAASIRDNNEKIDKVLRDMYTEFTAMKMDLAKIKEDISKGTIVSRGMESSEIEVNNPIEKEEVQQTIVAPEEKTEEVHPKQGKFDSSDVAIDKIFYYGKK